MTWNGFRSIRMAAAVGLVWLGLAGRSAHGAAPTNDNFATATVISGLGDFLGSNGGATAESGEPAHAGETAARSIWWKWTPPFVGSFSIVTSNSYISNKVQLDTTLAVYSGNSLTNLTRVAANDDTPFGEFGALWSRVVFRAYPTETLLIAVDSLTTTGSIKMRISQAGPPAQPWTATNLQGQLMHSSNFLGQVVLVDFWETTCGACVLELPDVIATQGLLQPRGFTFLGLSGDPNMGVVTNYLATNDVARQSLNYPIGMMNDSVTVTLNGGPIGFPTKVLLDREGRIMGQYLGGHDGTFYRDIVEPLLRASPQIPVGIYPYPAGSIRLTWPGTEPGYHVEVTSDVSANGSWVNSGYAPTLTNGVYAVSVVKGATNQFFRLVKP